MARTALNAPAHRVAQKVPFFNTATPRGAAPSMDYLGHGFQDHRLPYNFANSATGAQVVGWYGTEPVTVISQVPSTIATANISVGAVTASGVPAVLVSVSGAGITVLSASTIFFPSLLTISSGLVIDATPVPKQFGTASSGITAFYDPATMIGRAVSITGVAGGTGGNFLISGYDVYGYPMSELVAATAGATTANGKKAFKVITSAVPQFTDGTHNYSIGTADIFGFGILGVLWPNVEIFWNNAFITSSTGFVAPDQTTPATTATGDVRGTYAVQTASDNAKRLVVRVYPSLALMTTSATIGIFGVAQV